MASGFGVLDVSLDEVPGHTEPSPIAPPPSPSSPGSGVRTGMPAAARSLPQPVQTAPRISAAATPARAAVPAAQPARPQPSADAAAAGPRPAAASSAAGELGDQRLRQIYAKYVETKRSANESTAGITYEKLAATLRAQTEKLRAAHPSKAVDFDVVIKDGKTHLKPVLK
jgi:hypothetical protein